MPGIEIAHITGIERNVVSSARAKQLARNGRDLYIKGAHFGNEGESPFAHEKTRASLELGRETFIFDLPVAEPPVIGRFDTDDMYEGTVVSIDEQEGLFTARLANAREVGPEEEAEFSLVEVPLDDRSLVVPGADFLWAIGLQWRKRTATRVSEIRFRRRPAFTSAAITAAEGEGEKLSALLNALDAQFDESSRT